jgi:hypothetical protein
MFSRRVKVKTEAYVRKEKEALLQIEWVSYTGKLSETAWNRGFGVCGQEKI